MTVIVEESRITAKGQTTVPKAVRQALGVAPGERIAFRIEEHGVTVERVEDVSEDPTLGPFLDLLARDIAERPSALQSLTPELVARIAELTRHTDPDGAIEGEVAL